MNFILPIISWIQNKPLVPNIKTLTNDRTYQNIPNIPSCPSCPSFVFSLSSRFFSTATEAPNPKENTRQAGFFSTSLFSTKATPMVGAEILPAQISKTKNGVKECFCSIEYVFFVAKCFLKKLMITSQILETSVKNHTKFKNYSLTNLVDWTFPSNLLCLKFIISNESCKSHQRWVRVYFFGKFHNSWKWAGISWWQFLSTKELGIQLCRHHIQVTRQIHRLVGDVKKKNTHFNMALGWHGSQKKNIYIIYIYIYGRRAFSGPPKFAWFAKLV